MVFVRLERNKKYSLRVCDNSYYELHIEDNIELEIEDVIDIVKTQKNISGQKMPVLVLCDEFAMTGLDVMRYLSKNENFPYSTAGAYVFNSVAQKILANFYLKIHSPERPTKFFTKKDDAIDWLKQYI